MKIIELGVNVTGLGGVNRGNAGDTAIGSAFEYLFEQEFPNAKIEFMNCRKIFTKNDVKKINRSDLLVVAGGGLLLRDSMDKNGKSFVNSVSNWSWGISKELLEKITTPIIVHSIGDKKARGHPDFDLNFLYTMRILLRKSIFFSMRNTGSIQALKKYISPYYHDKIKLNFCPTLLLNDKYKFENKRNNKNVGFVIAGDRVDLRHQDKIKFGKQIKVFIDYLKFNGYKTILLNHLNDTWLYNCVDFNEYIDLYGKDSKTIYETYSKIDTVVGDRGHAQMIPFSVGCKILSPVSHDKLKWFLKDLGLENFGIEEYDKYLSSKLIKQFELQNKLDWKTVHSALIQYIRFINDKNTREIMSLI